MSNADIEETAGRRTCLWPALWCGMLAFLVARAAGVPLWNDGWRIGDATDIGAVTAMTVRSVLLWVRNHLIAKDAGRG